MFINPALLVLGGALATAPILLHLLMRQQPRRIEFPPLRFLARVEQSNRRTLRLRHWLLLALRMAIIAGLGIALARPTVESAMLLSDREGPVAAALVFDTMPRMDYRRDNQTRLDVARAAALDLLAQIPEDSQVAILDSSAGAGVFQVDLGSARQRVERLAAQSVGVNLPQALDSAVQLLKSSALPPEIYVFTDLSQAAWSVGAANTLAERLVEMPGVSVTIIDVGVENPRNFALEPLRLNQQVLATTTTLRLGVEVSAIGESGERTVEAYLLDTSGKAEQQAQETLRVGEDAEAVDLVLGRLTPGTHQGYVRLVGDDALAADNIRYFTVETRRAWKLLVAAPEPVQEQAFFLVEALAPLDFRRNGQARFEVEIVPFEQLAHSLDQAWSAVAFVDPPPLDENVWRRVGEYVTGGGRLAMFLGPGAGSPTRFNLPPALELLPGALSSQARYPGGDLHLTPEPAQHPLLKPFLALEGSIPWPEFPVFRYWQLNDPTGAQVLFSYSNGRPAVLEKIVGRGRVITMTTPVNDHAIAPDSERWNLLASGLDAWPFVMLANEVMLYLVGSADEQLNYAAGETPVMSLPQNAAFASLLVTPPAGDPFRATPQADQQSVLISDAAAVGNYRVQAGGSEHGFDRGFSVNFSANSTRLRQISPDELKSVLGDTEFRIAAGSDPIDREAATNRVGRELFPILVLLVALFLAGELVLANLFYRRPSAKAAA